MPLLADPIPRFLRRRGDYVVEPVAWPWDASLDLPWDWEWPNWNGGRK